MAIPVNYDPTQSLYMVRISMGSQFKGKSKDIDEYTREIKYTHSRDVRREIGAIRQVINVHRSNGCTKFFGAYFTNQVGKDQLTQFCRTADQQMKNIDPALHCSPLFMKIDLPDLASGSQFDALLSAIRSQVHEVVLNRIKTVIERSESTTLTTKTKTALIKMLDKTKDLNIVNDPAINADIERMRARINADQLRELRDEILVILDETKDRSSSLEIVDEIMITDPENPAAIPLTKDEILKSDRVLDIL